MRRSLPFLALTALLLGLACDDGDSVIGGSPGGDPVGTVYTIDLSAMASYRRSQSLETATRQVVGRDDSLGFESMLFFRLDYSPVEDWSPQPAEGSVHVFFSMKMDNDSASLVLPQWATPENPAESGFHLDMELLLLADSLDADSVRWDRVPGAGAPEALLDSMGFRVTAADSAFGDGDDPLTGRRTLREAPAEWFQSADTTARFFLLRAAPGQRGLVPLLAHGWNDELRPGFRIAWFDIDTVLVDGVAVPDTSFDTTFVAATWQSGVVRDDGATGWHSLSTGWAGQAILELPPFPPADLAGDWDPLTSSLASAWLRIPTGPGAYNARGGKVNLYSVGAYDSAGVTLDSDWLVSSDLVEEGVDTLSFSMVNVLRRHWIEDDTLTREDPVALALKFDDYYLLQPRKLTVAGLGDPEGPRPVLEIRVARAPDDWRQP